MTEFKFCNQVDLGKKPGYESRKMDLNQAQH